MSREELLSSLDEYDRIIKNLSENGLEKIVKMQNLSLNELEKIERMNNLSLNELNQIAIARNIKNYMNMSREDLLIALLKSNQSHTEIRKSNHSNKEIEETKKIFNELRNNFSKEKIKKIREKFDDKEHLDEYFKKLEEDSLTDKEKKHIKRYTKGLQKTEDFLRKLKEDLNKSKKYRYDIEDIEQKGIKEIENLFNKISEEDYYEPIKIRDSFDGNYIEYESRGDKDNNLSLAEYLNKIRPYLRDMIDNHKAHNEWKIQLIMKTNFISFLDINDTRIMHTKSDNIEIINGTETSDIINELFKSFLR